jgi:hypothetical protein
MNKALKIIFGLLIAFSFPAFAQDSVKDEITALDQAYLDVFDNKIEPIDYYLKFISSEVFVYGFKSDGESDQNGMIEMKFRSSLFNDKPVINIFDTKAKAVVFGNKIGLDESEITGMGGAGAFTFMQEPFYLFLNPDTKYQKLFEPEEIQDIASLTGAIEWGEVKTKDILDLKKFENPSSKLVESLANSARNIEAVEKMYLCEHPSEPNGKNGLRNYFLVIQKHRKGDQDIIQRVIYTDIKEHIATGQFVDFIFVDKRKRKKMIASSNKPIYDRKKK